MGTHEIVPSLKQLIFIRSYYLMCCTNWTIKVAYSLKYLRPISNWVEVFPNKIFVY